MGIKRLFSTAEAKGTENYLNTQKKYEAFRTLLYFSISAALFIAGFIQTGRRANLLTVVAILGCLPASKSAVSTVMYLRTKSCAPEYAEEIRRRSGGLPGLFDCVFTSYKKNFKVSHLAVRGNSVCGFTEDADFPENEFYKHIGGILKMDGHKETTVKIFKSFPRYAERLEQMGGQTGTDTVERAIVGTLKSVML